MVRYFFCPFLWFWGAAAARRLIQHEENGVEGRYIVLLKKNEISNDSVTSRIDELYDTVRQRSYDTVQLAHKFDGTLVPGFTIENADEQAIETLLENDDVLLIEQVCTKAIDGHITHLTTGSSRTSRLFQTICRRHLGRKESLPRSPWFERPSPKRR